MNREPFLFGEQFDGRAAQRIADVQPGFEDVLRPHRSYADEHGKQQNFIACDQRRSEFDGRFLAEFPDSRRFLPQQERDFPGAAFDLRYSAAP